MGSRESGEEGLTFSQDICGRSLILGGLELAAIMCLVFDKIAG